MHSGTRGKVSKKAWPSVLGGRTRSSTRTRPPWDQIADEDTETDNGKMEAEAVDCRRRHGLAPGTRPLSWVD